jgi:chemotaxis protein CheY-P-specific phosphatase CheC
MSTKVLICDDSGFARKQMARSVPDGWNVEFRFADNGQKALDIIQQEQIDFMFLDLNMPVMDGYQTMQVIKDLGLSINVIVVSGDVQPEAHRRMKSLGALDFIHKPIDNPKLAEILVQHGIYLGETTAATREKSIANNDKPEVPLSEKLDAFREMANVAMGQAGKRLAQLLDQFIDLPVPNVNLIETTELHMAIAEISHNESVSAVSQGFLSTGISGEALLIFNDSNFANMVKLLKYKQEKMNEQIELEALMDVSNIMVSACLAGLSEQLKVHFTHNHPIVLGQHCGLEELLDTNVSRWDRVLAIEIGYAIKSHEINFDLLLLFPDKSIDLMFDKLVKVLNKSC